MNKMLYFSRTEIGNIRKNNEDSLFIKEYNDYLILAICDGMGGHNSGEVASRMAVELVERWEPKDEKTLLKSLKKLVEEININIYLKSKSSPELSGMGTTLSIAVIKENKVFYAHVGDSRIYVYDDNLKQITCDHTLTAELIRKGIEVDGKKLSNFITRAVGVTTIETPDLGVVEIDKPYAVFLCTDGVTKYFSDEEIGKVIEKEKEADVVNYIVDECLERGGKDNVTCILAKIGE